MKKLALVLALGSLLSAPAFAASNHGQAHKAQHAAYKAQKHAMKAEHKAEHADHKANKKAEHAEHFGEHRTPLRHGEDYISEERDFSPRRGEFPGNPSAPAYGRRAQEKLLLSRFDTNRDGVLSSYERERAASQLRQERFNRERGLPGFRADRNGDGYISREEHRWVRQQRYLEEALARYVRTH